MVCGFLGGYVLCNIFRLNIVVIRFKICLFLRVLRVLFTFPPFDSIVMGIFVTVAVVEVFLLPFLWAVELLLRGGEALFSCLGVRDLLVDLANDFALADRFSSFLLIFLC